MKKISNWVKDKVKVVSNSKYKHIAGFLVFVLVIGLFGGFSGIGNVKSYDSADMYYGNTNGALVESMGSLKADIYSDSVSSIFDGFTTESATDSSMGVYYEPESPSENQVVSERDYLATDNTAYESQTEKLIYSADIGIETKDIDVALERIYEKIKEYNGIIQDERQNNMGNVVYEDYYRYSANASAYIYVRIPQEHYDDFINSIEDEKGDIVVSDISKNVQNMTKVYYDTESRLRSLRVQEERLFEFMESANTVADMLDVEDRLTDVQYEIDSATNSLAMIDNDVKYSKITLNIEEVVKYSEKTENPKNFIERVWSYIKGSAENFADTLEEWLEFIIYFIPYLVILIIVYIIFIKVKRKIQKKRKDKRNLKNQDNIE